MKIDITSGAAIAAAAAALLLAGTALQRADANRRR